MSISKSNAENQYDQSNANLLNNQASLSNSQLDYYNQIKPNLVTASNLQLGQDIKNASSPVYDWQRNTAANLTSQMPLYSSIGINSPQVQQFSKLYNDNTDALQKQYQTQSNNDSAARQDFGSSYRAGEQARLGDLFDQQKSQNQLQSIDAATNLQNNNLNSFMGLMGALTQSPQYALPTSPNLAMPTGNYDPYSQNPFSQIVKALGQASASQKSTYGSSGYGM